ncbi:MAG: galactose-1-phosphate uridylyltransferase [Bacteroidota bacterium]
MNDKLTEYSHRRFNPLTGEWVQVSPHRTKRPWQGQQETVAEDERPDYDPDCYLCPGNTRAGGAVNPDYQSTFSFKNDFGAITEDIEDFEVDNGLLQAKSERGICKVLCFSPRHNLTLPQMSVDAIVEVVQMWKNEYHELGAKPFVNHVQIFENKGEVMGCSNPHPHGQVWAQESLPDEAAKKHVHQKKYFAEKKRTLLSDYIAQELALKERVLYENEDVVVLVPYWAVWPYETMILPKNPSSRILALGFLGSIMVS